MQSNKFNTISAGNSVTLQIAGGGFWYESGASSTANPYIVVKPSTGGTEIRLKPGQSVSGLLGQPFWVITAEDPPAVITGSVIIGDADFNDDNTANLVTITATAVTNAAALPVQKQALNTLTNLGQVSVGTAAVALISDPTQRVLRVRNAHPTAKVAIGAAGITLAAAAIVLGPGDLWIEEEGAGAAWFAISDTAATPVNLQGLKL